MLEKLTKKTLSLVIGAILMVSMFSSTVKAANQIGIQALNTAPVITLVGSIPIVKEDSTTPGVVTLSATDKEGQRFTWSIVSATLGNATLKGILNPTRSGTIKVNFTPSANKNGTSEVIVQAKDRSGAASQYTISIVIQPVNDPPVCSTLPSISGTVGVGQTISAADGLWKDIETPAEALVYSYQWQLSATSTGTNIVNAANTKTYTISSSDSNKYIRVAVTVSDNGDNGDAPKNTTAYSSWVLIGQQQPVKEPQYYVALGDSIAAGTNNINPLTGYSYRYTNTFSSSLASIFSGTSYGYKNDATPGDTTDDLLSKLQTNSTIRSDVSKATIITISIGGNNVLSSASSEGYSKINDTAASNGIANFEADLPVIVGQINSLHAAGHYPQIYIMDMYNLYHPWERGWVVYSNGSNEEVFMNQAIYSKYLLRMQYAIDNVSMSCPNVYRVNTYDAFESFNSRYIITKASYLKQNSAFVSPVNPNGYYFYSPYIEKTAVYTDNYTRFDVYPFYPIAFDYAHQDKYRDPHPDQAGHNILSQAHLAKFKQVNNLN